MKLEIIEYAVRQLRRSGYYGLSFAAIATELRITRANIHHHFGNKLRLATAAVNHYIEAEASALESVISANNETLDDFLSGLETYLIDGAKGEFGRSACICAQIARDASAPPELREIVQQAFKHEEQRISGVVRGFLNDKEENQSAILTARILTIMHGVEMLRQIEPNIAAIEDHVRGTLSQLARLC